MKDTLGEVLAINQTEIQPYNGHIKVHYSAF